MTLTTHALVGAAAASLFPGHPYIAFAAGFASHFAIDAIPHWDYTEWLLSVKKDATNPLHNDMLAGKDAWEDFAIIAADALIGFVLTFFVAWILQVPLSIALVGAGAGIYPDFIQFIYYKTRLEAMEWLQWFHVVWIQEGKRIYPQPIVGLAWQALLIAGVVLAVWLIRHG